MSGSSSRPFNLLRYFTSASFAIVLATTLGAGIGSAVLVRAVFTQMERDEADSLAEYFVTEFAQGGFPPSRWGVETIPSDMRERALSDMRNYDLSELKLLAPDGRELLTLGAGDGSPSPRWPEGLDIARTGRVALRWGVAGGWRSNLFFSRPSGALESYIPVRDGGPVVAVVKIVHHLEPVIAAAQRSLFVIVGLSGLAGLAIFGSLTLLVRRADRIIRRQHDELTDAHARLEERNRRLEDVERRKDEFYATCSHDLRSPLVSAQAGIRLALDDPTARLTADQRDILAESSQSVHEVLALIGNLLDMARAEAHEDALEVEPVDLRELLEGVVSTHRLMGVARDVTITTTFPGEAVIVEADRLKLVRVFGNLVSNAIKYSGGRPVEISLGEVQGRARAVVHDSGPGIPAERREALFGRFVRGPAEADDGAGLGLAIVREFVYRHGGTVTCESEPGLGTSFVVELPISVAAGAPVSI